MQTFITLNLRSVDTLLAIALLLMLILIILDGSKRAIHAALATAIEVVI